jgi:hypothetical protein
MAAATHGYGYTRGASLQLPRQVVLPVLDLASSFSTAPARSNE